MTDSVPLILDVCVLVILDGSLLNKNKVKSLSDDFQKQISDQWKQLCGQTIITVNNDASGVNPSKLFFSSLTDKFFIFLLFS
jgi:hypothetical protein